MANANVARGLIPYRHFNGSVWNGSVNMYYVPSTYATALYVGDPVDIISSSNDANGIPAVKLATSGSPIVGSVVGIVSGGNPVIAVTRDLPIYHAASTAQYILVCDDAEVLYMIQDDATTNGSFNANTWPSKNANLVSGSGSTITGYSGWQLGASTVATTNTLDLKIMRPLDESDNTIPSASAVGNNAKWLVKLNNYRFAGQTAGV